ncbi:MAG: DOPA 4,5-dioxygenase family protein [Bdellovibrionales bacterium]|nr:DOPA 4,5-dioxygenase family protein [Bdellovibrionales bacterium]
MAYSSLMRERRSDFFHSHIYFTAETRVSASALQQFLLRDLPRSVHISRLVDRPIGPHPLPMFELGFSASEYDEVRNYLEAHRGPHTALIHQVTEDEVWDHTEGAEWLGTPVPLDIQFLRDFMAGKSPGVSGTVPFVRKN